MCINVSDVYPMLLVPLLVLTTVLGHLRCYRADVEKESSWPMMSFFRYQLQEYLQYATSDLYIL
jgi:hypothetical protein